MGYEKPDLKRDLIDVGTTGLQDATYATGAGVATAGLAKAAPAVAALLNGAARGTERRVLSNVFGSLSKTKPLSDAAVDTAAEHGAFKLFGTSGGAAQRLETAREGLGQQYASILADLEKQGITGPDAAKLAQQYAARMQTVNAGTMNPAVPKIYESAAEQVAGKPTTGGTLGLSQTEDLKRSLQGMAKSAYQQRQPTEVGRAHEDTASMMRQAVEDAITKQTTAPSVQAAIRDKTTGAVYSGPSHVEAMRDLPADAMNRIEQGTFRGDDGFLLNGRFVTREEALGAVGGPKGKSFLQSEDVRSPSADLQALGERFVPVKQELGKLIEGSNVAREGMAREGRRSYFSLPDAIAAASGYSHSGSPLQAAATGMASHFLRTRGPSTAAVVSRFGSDVAGAFPSIAPQAERAAMSVAPMGAERQRLAGWMDELLRLIQQKSSPAPLAQADQQ